MLDSFVASAGDYIQTNPWLALVAVFVGGALTASNPCVLAMIPLMMGFVAGQRAGGRSVLRAFGFSLVFVTGLAVTFTAMGMVAAVAGKMYGDVSHVWHWVVALVCLIMGLHLTGLITVPIPSLGGRFQPKTRGLVGTLVLGLLFGVVSAPCAAPILVVLLTYLAGSGASIPFGGLLLLVYALGHSLLIIAAGTSMGAARALMENKKMTRAADVLRKGAGVVIVLIGLFFGLRGLETEEAAVNETPSPVEAKEAKSEVVKVVFIGQKEACECTRKRVDDSLAALEQALKGREDITFEKLNLDVDESAVAPYQEMEAIMVAPAIYLLDDTGALVEVLQGEVTVEQMAMAMGAR
jgi:cytochrome c biogenesis protein CcdA